MSRHNPPDPGKRLFIIEVLEGASGFFRTLTEELRSPSVRERELVAVRGELGELE